MVYTNEISSVIFIGFASSGKTTIGKALAEQLSWGFLDTDRLLEKKVQDDEGLNDKLPCRGIFKRYGVIFFRQKERVVLQSIQDSHHTIIATGGGMPLYSENRKRLVSLGFLVYLQAFPEDIFNRCRQKGLPISLGPNAKEHLAEQYQQRNTIYQQMANYCLNTSGKTIPEITTELLEIISIT